MSKPAMLVGDVRSSIRTTEWLEPGWAMVRELREAKPQGAAKVRGRMGWSTIRRGVVKCSSRKIERAERVEEWGEGSFLCMPGLGAVEWIDSLGVGTTMLRVKMKGEGGVLLV